MKNKIFKYTYLAVLYLPIILNMGAYFFYVYSVIYASFYGSTDNAITLNDNARQLVFYFMDLQIITMIAILIGFIGFILSLIFKWEIFKKLGKHCLISFALLIFYNIPLMGWFLDT